MVCPNCEQEVCRCGPYVLDFRTWRFFRKDSVPQTQLRVNVIGDGSAGKRHARMLQERGCAVRVYGPGDMQYANCDAVVIASPPETHKEYLIQFVCRYPVLCEGPVTWPYPVKTIAAGMTAENWLFVPEVQRLAVKCTSPFPPRPVHAHLWFDYDLAKWRGPGWAYKDSCYYTSGILNINVHEVMVALALFGPAADARVHTNYTGKSKETDAFTASISHASGVISTINCGWHSSVYRRGIQVFYEDGSSDELSWTSPQDDGVANASYGAMLDHWLDCIRTGKEPSPSLYDGYRAYKLLQGECI